jgi:hypothetical protein
MVALGGGGLPDITLKAPNWRSDASGLTSDVIGGRRALDVPPLQGLAGTLAGQVRLGGGGLTLRLNRCTPLTAKAIAMGEPPISAVKFQLCPSRQPLVVASGGVWRVSALIKDGAGPWSTSPRRGSRASTPASSAAGAASTSPRSRSPAAGWSRPRDGKRFETLAATGQVDLARGQWTGGLDGKTLDGRPLGRITIRHDVASGRGQADIDASKLVFAKGGLQPLGLTPLAEIARDAEGPVAFTGRFAWNGDVMTSQGRASTPGLDFKSPLGQVHRLKGEIVFDSLAPLTGAARPGPDGRQRRRHRADPGGPGQFRPGRRGAASGVDHLRGLEGQGHDRADRRAAGRQGRDEGRRSTSPAWTWAS